MLSERLLGHCSKFTLEKSDSLESEDNNDLNQAGRPVVLEKTRVWLGCSVSQAHKTLKSRVTSTYKIV